MGKDKGIMISSISYNQQEIINNILQLHGNNKQIDADITYSKGVFYKSGEVKQPQFKFDLFPQTADTIQASTENLPIKENSLDVVMYDPPFICGGGPSKTGIMRNRFSCFKTIESLWLYYTNTLKETHRILKKNGILIFKCQDTISGGKQYLSHVYITNESERLGFYAKDLFILLAKSRLSNWKTQQHARKFHSYFLVLRKK